MQYIYLAGSIIGLRCNNEGTFHYSVKGKIGFPFFGELILDCIDRTENAMTQEHAFKAAELCLIAQKHAVRLE